MSPPSPLCKGQSGHGFCGPKGELVCVWPGAGPWGWLGDPDSCEVRQGTPQLGCEKSHGGFAATRRGKKLLRRLWSWPRPDTGVSDLLCMNTGSPWQVAWLSSAVQTPLSMSQGGRRESPPRCVPPLILLLLFQGNSGIPGCSEGSWVLGRGTPSLCGSPLVHAAPAGGPAASGCWERKCSWLF